MPKTDFRIDAGGGIVQFTTRTPAETVALGKKIGKRLVSGMVVALEGPLGAGKTCLAKGILRAAGVRQTVTSPSYAIINEYEGAACAVYHIDTYRLAGADDFTAAGGAELLAGPGIFVIEWPERVAALLPARTFRVGIGLRDDGRRVLSMPAEAAAELQLGKRMLSSK